MMRYMVRSFALLLALGASVSAADTTQYFFGFLKSAPTRVELPKEEAAKLQAAHIGHLEAMNERGGLVCAGPLANGGPLRGVVIYKTATQAEALTNASADPAVKRGQLAAELFEWTGPAGIGDEYKRRAKEGAPVKMVKYHLLITKPGATFPGKGSVASGPYRDGGDAGQILIFPELSAEERKKLEGQQVKVLLDWYVADGVLPAARQ